MIPLSEHLRAIAADGRRLWVLTHSRTPGFDSIIRAYDARTGTPLGPSIAAGRTTAVAAGTRFAWLMNERGVTPVDAKTFRVRPSIVVSRDSRLRSSAIAATGTSDVWVVLETDSGPNSLLVRVNGVSGRVTRKIALPASLPNLSFHGAFSVVGGTALISSNCFTCEADDDALALRVDLRTGRVTRIGGAVFAGFGHSWSFDALQLRRDRTGPRFPLPGGARGTLETYEPISVGPTGVWTVRFAPRERGLFAPGASVRYFDALTGRVSARHRVELPRQEFPVFPLAVGEHIAAVPGGAWIGLEEYGVLVRVPVREPLGR